MLPGLRFHHHGLALKNEQAALTFLGLLGYELGAAVYDPLQNVHLRMCTHPSAPSVELVLPGQGDGPLTSLLKRNEFVFYHTCYEVADRDAALRTIEHAGLRVTQIAPPLPAVLFGGREVSFYSVLGYGIIELLI